jgi:DNA-binding XRE family transcriptional regulator
VSKCGLLIRQNRLLLATKVSGHVVTLVTTRCQGFRYNLGMRKYPYLAEAIANTIESLRNIKGMSKSSLADFADIERGYVRDIEKGNRKPTVNTIFCICEALQVDPLDFFAAVVNEIRRLENSAK